MRWMMRMFFPLALGEADTYTRTDINPVDTPAHMRGGVTDKQTDSLTAPGESSTINLIHTLKSVPNIRKLSFFMIS